MNGKGVIDCELMMEQQEIKQRKLILIMNDAMLTSVRNELLK